ncbi:MAG: hypothetical protein ACK5MV_10630 [Aminipila sp.]
MNLIKPQHISKPFIYACMGIGNSKPDSQTEKIIEECSELVLNASQPRVVYKAFELNSIVGREQTEEVYIENSKFKLLGSDILLHLKGCKRCVLMAVTLGSGVDKLLRITQIKDMAKAVVMDACASSLTEDICDQINEKLELEYGPKGVELISRFSPGYGDFTLAAQDIFSGLLNMEKEIGLTQTKEHLLIPRKSVTAVIGLRDKNKSEDKEEKDKEEKDKQKKDKHDKKIDAKGDPCKICIMNKNCSFRKSGGYCGRIKD